jgi:hypothetical protein
MNGRRTVFGIVDLRGGGLAERVHDAPGGEMPDAVDQAAAEASLHPLERGG